MKLLKKLKIFQRYESLKEIQKIKIFNRSSIKKNFFKLKNLNPTVLIKKTKILSEKLFFSFLKNFLKKHEIENFILNSEKISKQIWIPKIQIGLKILLKTFYNNKKLWSYIKMLFTIYLNNIFKIFKLNWILVLTNDNPMFFLYPLICFPKFYHFKYKVKNFKRKKEQKFFNFYKIFFFIEIKNFLSFIKFYKKKFISFFKGNKILWKNIYLKKDLVLFFFDFLKKNIYKIDRNSFSFNKKSWLNFIKFTVLLQFCSNFFCITNYYSYLTNKGSFREKNLFSLNFKEKFCLLKQTTHINLNKLLLTNSFFTLKNKKSYLFNDNPNHLRFFLTLIKISIFFKNFSKKISFFKYNFCSLKRNFLFNKILRNQIKKFCFYRFFYKSFFFKNFASKNLSNKLNPFNKKNQMDSNRFFSKKKNFLNKTFFEICVCQSNFQQIFLNDSFYFLYQKHQIFNLKDKKNMLNFKKLQKFLQKKGYKIKPLRHVETKWRSILTKSLKDVMFIEHKKNSFFIKIFFERIVVFLLKSFKFFFNSKFKEKIFFNQKKWDFKNLNQFNKKLSFRGFSIFFINSNLIFEKNRKYLKKTLFSLETFNKSAYYIKRKILFFPSKREIKKHLINLQKRIYKNLSQSQQKLLLKLKHQIINWCYCYRIISRQEIFIYCDKFLNNLLWKWLLCIHINKSKRWIKQKYFVILKKKKLFSVLPYTFSSKKPFKKIFYLPSHS